MSITEESFLDSFPLLCLSSSITDHSSNGTYLNGVQVQKGVHIPLSFNDKIGIYFKEELRLEFTLVPYDGSIISSSLTNGSQDNSSISVSHNQSIDEASDALALKPQIKALKEENRYVCSILASFLFVSTSLSHLHPFSLRTQHTLTHAHSPTE